jgi:hypothetical protein
MSRAGEKHCAMVGAQVRTPRDVTIDVVTEIQRLAPMVAFTEGYTEASQTVLYFAVVENDE